MGRWRVGIDAGGTFTDLCIMAEDGRALHVSKVPSTPAEPSRAVVDGLQGLLRRIGAEPADLGFFSHGTTVATNALIEHRGARVGLLTTAGFRDVLEIARQRRSKLYDLQVDRSVPLVPRDLRIEIDERVLHDGTVVRAPDPDQARAAIRSLRAAGVEAIAICFLYSYVRADHERLVEALVADEWPECFVSTSSAVAAEFREYERLNTVVTNAYLQPLVSRYLCRLRHDLGELGVDAPLHVTQSTGGIVSFPSAEARPVGTVLSGPSTGLIGVSRIARAAGFRNVVTLDIGGTSADVSVLVDGEPRFVGELEVDGRPLKTAALDISAVGAGGGSIAWIDSGGRLRVGPQSAGAEPGPACYRRGGTAATVTDANVMLHTIDPAARLGDALSIDEAAAAAAIDGVAAALGTDRLTAAHGVLRVMTANMARAIRVISVQRGHDLRDFTLVAFGGAGPLHASRLASELHIPRVVVPPNPGVLCALGLLLTDLRTTYSVTRPLTLRPDRSAEVAATFADLLSQATAWFDAEGVEADRRVIHRSVDLRYAGQNFELNVRIPGEATEEVDLPALRTAFELVHEREYGFRIPDEEVAAVTFRLEATGRVDGRLTSSPAPREGGNARVGERQVCLDPGRGYTACAVYSRDLLRPGDVVAGPAIIDQMDATTLVLENQTARVDDLMNIVLEVTDR